MSQCGESGTLRVLECGNPGNRGWQRWANQDEIDFYHASGDLPPHLNEANLQVSSCDDHAQAAGFAEPYDYGEGNVGFVGTDIATMTHDAGCRQPAEIGDCGVCTTYFAGTATPREEG